MGQAAYDDSRWDFSMFEEQPKVERIHPEKQKQKNKLKLIPGGKTALLISKAGKATLFGLVFSLVFFSIFIFGQSQRDEARRELTKYENELKAIKNENIQLDTKIESQFSLSDVEKYAVQTLGMAKADNYQIEYIDMSKGDMVTLHQDDNKANIHALINKFKGKSTP